MKRIRTVLFILAILPFTAQMIRGQGGGGLKISAGMASFRMDDLKSLQKYILGTYPVEGKVTSSFPPFTYTSIFYFRQLYEQVRVGGGYSFSTAGGKSSYRDYSGFLITDISATSHRLGAYAAYAFAGGDRLALSLYGTLEANLSTVSIETYYTILYYSRNILNHYRSWSPTGTIGCEASFSFKRFAIGVQAGYLVDLTGQLKDSDDGDDLLDPNDRTRVLTTDWTGWVAQLGITVPLR
jgi:hypothetical protein